MKFWNNKISCCSLATSNTIFWEYIFYQEFIHLVFFYQYTLWKHLCWSLVVQGLNSTCEGLYSGALRMTGVRSPRPLSMHRLKLLLEQTMFSLLNILFVLDDNVVTGQNIWTNKLLKHQFLPPFPPVLLFLYVFFPACACWFDDKLPGTGNGAEIYLNRHSEIF